MGSRIRIRAGGRSLLFPPLGRRRPQVRLHRRGAPVDVPTGGGHVDGVVRRPLGHRRRQRPRLQEPELARLPLRGHGGPRLCRRRRRSGGRVHPRLRQPVLSTRLGVRPGGRDTRQRRGSGGGGDGQRGRCSPPPLWHVARLEDACDYRGHLYVPFPHLCVGFNEGGVKRGYDEHNSAMPTPGSHKKYDSGARDLIH